MGNAHLGSQAFDGLLDLAPAQVGWVSLSIAMDEQSIAWIGYECELNFSEKSFGNVTETTGIRVAHIDADVPAVRLQQPFKDGDQHHAVGWAVGQKSEPKRLHSAS